LFCKELFKTCIFVGIILSTKECCIVVLTYYTTGFAKYQELLGKTGYPCHDKCFRLNAKKM
jgi:hypothetical protein